MNSQIVKNEEHNVDKNLRFFKFSHLFFPTELKNSEEKKYQQIHKEIFLVYTYTAASEDFASIKARKLR